MEMDFQFHRHTATEKEFADDDQIKASYYPETEQLLKDVYVYPASPLRVVTTWLCRGKTSIMDNAAHVLTIAAQHPVPPGSSSSITPSGVSRVTSATREHRPSAARCSGYTLTSPIVRPSRACLFTSPRMRRRS